MNSTGKQKEHDTSVADQSLSKSSEKKRKKRDFELSCGERVHAFSKQVTKNISHNNQLELGKTFCESLWGQNVPDSVTLMGVDSEGEEKMYKVCILGTRLSKGFSEFINHLNVQPGDFISLDPLGENQLKFCIHRGKGGKGGKELALVGSSDLGQSQSQAGSLSHMLAPPASHCGTLGLDLGLSPASTSEVRIGEALAEFESSELAQGLEEEVRKEYLAMCKRMMCLPHKSKRAHYYAMEGITLMVKVLRQMRTIGITEEGLTSIKNSLQLLEDYGFECEYLSFVFEKISSAQESFKKCEEAEDELRARKAALDERLRMFQGTL